MAQTREKEIYQITVQGRLDKGWAPWFEGMTFSYGEDGNTILTGPVADQPALLGLLIQLGHLNMSLLSLSRIWNPSDS